MTIMGYFNDVFDMFGMEDKAFQKVGNDKHSFRRMFWADILTSYIIGLFLFIFILFYFMIFVYSITQQEAGPFWLYGLFGFIGFMIAPFVLFGLNFIFSWFIHLIGLMFGGKPKSYIDFFQGLEISLCSLWQGVPPHPIHRSHCLGHPELFFSLQDISQYP